MRGMRQNDLSPANPHAARYLRRVLYRQQKAVPDYGHLPVVQGRNIRIRALYRRQKAVSDDGHLPVVQGRNLENEHFIDAVFIDESVDVFERIATAFFEPFIALELFFRRIGDEPSE